MGTNNAFSSFKKYIRDCHYFHSAREVKEYVNYFTNCKKIVESKRDSTWWADDHAPFFDKMISHTGDTSFYTIFEGGSVTSSYVPGYYSHYSPKLGTIEYNVKSRPFYCFQTGILGSLVFYQKANKSDKYISIFDENNNSLNISIANYAFNKNGETILISNFDAKGKPHKNDFSYIKDDTYAEQYKKFFGDIAYAPHFHFNSSWQNDCPSMSRPNAISLEKLQEYLKALESNDEFLNSNSLGMPFLAIKQGRLKYKSNFPKVIEHLLKKNEIKNPNARRFFEEIIKESSLETYDMKDSNQQFKFMPYKNTPTNLYDIKNDISLFNVYTEFFYNDEENVLNEFANAILCSINGSRYTPISTMHQKHEGNDNYDERKNNRKNKKQ